MGRFFYTTRGLAVFIFLIFLVLAPVKKATAGVDLWVHVVRIQIAGDGKIWFAVDGSDVTNYCKSDWNGLTMYIPPDNPQYSYLYTVLLSSLLKGKGIIVANISIYNGTSACDITKTGYGLVLLSSS